MDRHYPIGKFSPDEAYDSGRVAEHVATIAAFPEAFRQVATRVQAQQLLDKSYRPDGWTGRQVITHVADSHMNALWRFKFALTADNPHLPGYNQPAWANTRDVDGVAVDKVLDFIDLVHLRWQVLMEGMSPTDWQRTFWHTEYKREYILWRTAALYAWHGAHHQAHLQLLLDDGTTA